MTDEQLNERWQVLCKQIAREARRRGAKDPFIYACEGGICVFDGDPPFRSGQEIFILRKPPLDVAAFDAGGW